MTIWQKTVLLVLAVVAYAAFSFPRLAMTEGQCDLARYFYNTPGIAALIALKLVILSVFHLRVARWSARFLAGAATLVIAALCLMAFFGELLTQKWETTVSNPIRIDLLVIPPLLLLLELGGLVVWFVGWFLSPVNRTTEHAKIRQPSQPPPGGDSSPRAAAGLGTPQE